MSFGRIPGTFLSFKMELESRSNQVKITIFDRKKMLITLYSTADLANIHAKITRYLEQNKFSFNKKLLLYMLINYLKSDMNLEKLFKKKDFWNLDLVFQKSEAIKNSIKNKETHQEAGDDGSIVMTSNESDEKTHVLLQETKIMNDNSITLVKEDLSKIPSTESAITDKKTTKIQVLERMINRLEEALLKKERKNIKYVVFESTETSSKILDSLLYRLNDDFFEIPYFEEFLEHFGKCLYTSKESYNGKEYTFVYIKDTNWEIIKSKILKKKTPILFLVFDANSFESYGEIVKKYNIFLHSLLRDVSFIRSTYILGLDSQGWGELKIDRMFIQIHIDELHLNGFHLIALKDWKTVAEMKSIIIRNFQDILS